MLKKLSLSIALAVAAASSQADTVVAEIGAGYSKYDVDGNSLNAINLYGTWFINTLTTDGLPLAEAAFLTKANSLTLTYDSIESGDVTTLTARGEFYIPSAYLYLAPYYSSVDFDGFGSENDWGVEIGVTPIDGLLISTTYSDEYDYELNLDAKYVTQLSGDTAINIELGYAKAGDGEGDDTFDLGADYFFDSTLSVGAAIIDSDETGYAIRTRKFFTQTVSAEASYITYDDLDIVNLELSMRF